MMPARSWLQRLTLTVLVAGAPAFALAEAPPLQPLTVSGFVSASNLPLWAGLQNGFFAREGIDLHLVSPSGSIDQMRSLAAGTTPVLLTAFDNVVAYQRGQGASDIGAVPDFIAVAAIDRGMLTLVAAPGISAIQDLRGRTFAVDAPDTGFSFALKGVLAHAGVDPANIAMIAVGNTAARWKALQDGRASAAVLSIPADVIAAQKGFAALTTVDAALGPYLGNVVATRRTWADAHRPLLAAFLLADRRSIAWTMAPENRDATLAILRHEMPDLTPDMAVSIYDRLLDDRTGLFRGLNVDPAAARAVLALRARFGPPSSASADPASYFDQTFATAEPPTPDQRTP